MNVKNPTTITDQITIIENRGCIVDDRKFAEKILSKINYYRLTAYFLPFKQLDDKYQKGLTFEKIYNIYEFDRRLRSIVFPIIEEIEIMLRVQFSYHHAHTYGALGYLDENNFNNRHNHIRFIEHINNSIKNNDNQLFVQHHLKKYCGKFPIWVIIELFSMGELSFFYSDMKTSDKKLLAKKLYDIKPEHLSSWLLCLTYFRNYCAHYSRLYYTLFPAIPKNPQKVNYNLGKGLFDYLLILKFLYTNIGDWDKELFKPLQSLLEEYFDHIELHHVNFPENWYDLLR